MPGGRAPSYRWFGWALIAVAAAGLAIRVAYVVLERQDIDFGGDARFYHEGANLLAEGEGFISPFAHDAGRVMESAEHPPLYVVFLAIPSLLRLTSTLSHLLWSCALGAATIVLVGLLGRLLAGDRVGILAAALLAVYPNAWMADGSLQAETPAMFTTALAALLAYYCWQQPSWRRFAAVGASCGLAALVRSELVLLLPALVVPLAFLVRGPEVRSRLQWLGAGLLAALIVLAPWVGYNLVRFRHPVLLVDSYGAVLAASNCDATYSGPLLGFFSIPCARAIADREIGPDADGSQQDIVYRREALEYVRAHKGRVPVVMAARAGRVLGVFNHNQQVTLDSFLGPFDTWLVRLGVYTFWAVALLAVPGAVVLRRRQTWPLFPLLVPPAVALVAVMVTYGNPRFRFAGATTLLVLAAVAIDAVIARVRPARASVTPGEGDD